jgi:hypothetical protein
MGDRLLLVLEPDVRAAIRAELGSMSAFHDRLEGILLRELGDYVSISESSQDDAGEGGLRGGDIVEIITAVTGMLAAVAPIVIAWIRSRGFEVQEKIETRKSGTVLHSLRVRRGAIR